MKQKSWPFIVEAERESEYKAKRRPERKEYELKLDGLYTDTYTNSMPVVLCPKKLCNTRKRISVCPCDLVLYIHSIYVRNRFLYRFYGVFLGFVKFF